MKNSQFYKKIILQLKKFGRYEHEDIEKAKIFQLTTIFGSIITLYVFVFGIALCCNNDLYLGIFDISMGVVGFANIILLHKTKNINTARNVVIAILSTIILYMVYSGGKSGTGLAWIALYPLVVLPLSGFKKGSFYSLALLSLVIAIYLLGEKIDAYDYVTKHPYTKILFQRLIFIYLAIFIIAFSFVRNRNSLYKEIKHASLTDSLTCLPNRRAINDMLEYHINVFKRSTYKKKVSYNENIFSCILCDIDFFKKVNDNHGHLCGDKLLKQIAFCLKTSLRETDFVGRWGGEEFLIILHNTNLSQAKTTAKKLRKKVESCVFPLDNKKTINVTISCGVSCYKKEEPIINFIKELDNNLYLAKENGRNCIAVKGKIIS